MPLHIVLFIVGAAIVNVLVFGAITLAYLGDNILKDSPSPAAAPSDPVPAVATPSASNGSALSEAA